MKARCSISLLVALLILSPHAKTAAAAVEDGVAVAIIFDTSGSMGDKVRDRDGKSSPKSVIAQRALDAVVARFQAFAASHATASAPRRLEVGLYGFSADGAKVLAKFGPFDPLVASRWTKALPAPNGGTPLGNALGDAGRAALHAGLSRAHVLVITDGVNTVGPPPESVLPDLKAQAASQAVALAVHFVAFDVDAKRFDPLKKLDVTVLGAANEAQLNTQLGFILEKKILLEEEEPAAPPKTH